MAITIDELKRNVFPGESGGDYNALFGYANRPGGQFAGTNLTDMTVDQALQFASPSGPYGQSVKGQIGRVATPMGAWQVVGTTLKAAKQGLGLTGSEKMTPELQDAIGMWIYQAQGPGAWEGWGKKGAGGGGSASAAAASAPNTGTMPMGLLDMQDEPQTFAERLKSQWQSGELGDRIALAANTLRLNPDQNLAAALQDRQQAREQKSTMNRTAQWLQASGRPDLAQAMMTGALDAKSAVAVAMQPADPLAAINLEKARLELQKLKEPQPGFRPATAEEAAVYGATSGQIGPDGKFYPSETQMDKGVVVDKRVINPVTGEVIYEPPQGANVSLTDEQLSNINTMRDDLRAQTATFDIVKNGFDNIQAFYTSPGAVSDYALAVGFAKIVDPGSVAREGEVAAVAGAGAMFPSLGTALKNAFDGTGKLTPETRAEIFALAQKMYVNKANDTTATIDQYKELARRAGLPEDMLWMGGNISMPGPQITPQPQPSPTIDTMPPPGTAPRPTMTISPRAQSYLP